MSHEIKEDTPSNQKKTIPCYPKHFSIIVASFMKKYLTEKN